jgi:hypothetical protein
MVQQSWQRLPVQSLSTRLLLLLLLLLVVRITA